MTKGDPALPVSRRRFLLRAGGALLAAGIIAITLTLTLPYLPAGPPGSLTWPRARPEEVGMDGERLRSVSRDLGGEGTVALLVLCRGKVVLERYAPGRGPWRPQRAASLTKSLVGSLAALIAAERGWIDLDEPVARFIHLWRDDPVRSRITFRHLLSHTSGIPNGLEGSRVESWAAPFWKGEPDLFEAILPNVPVATPPRSADRYSGPGYAVLSYAMAAALRERAAPDPRSILRTEIREPLGIPPRAWPLERNPSFDAGRLRVHAMWSGTTLTTRAAARVGELMMGRGRWRSTRILDSTLARAAVTPAPGADRTGDTFPVPGLGWWSNANGALPELPAEAFLGAGNGGQILLVVPGLELVVVRFGTGLGDLSAGPDFWLRLRRDLVGPLMDCFRGG